MHGLALVAFLLALAGLFGYINERFLRFPHTVGLMAVGMAASLILIVLDKTQLYPLKAIASVLISINFETLLLHGLLAFLLFAGALHVRLDDLKRQWLPVACFATLGVLLSAILAAILFYTVARVLGVDLPFVYALLFGALISPTDPVAVIGILRGAGAPRSLSTKIAGESLFNDGTGVVLFLTILGVLAAPDLNTFSLTSASTWIYGMHAAFRLFYEILLAILLGLALGFIAYRLIKSIESYSVEILLTLALASGTYSLAEYLHVSAPIAVVTAGLIIGNHGRSYAMSQKTQEHLDTFWELIDETLNALLFALMGLQIIVLTISGKMVWLSLAAIPVVIVARFISIWLIGKPLARRWSFHPHSTILMTWAGMRGGISIALALAIPSSQYTTVLLTVTYGVVAFSILVQGLTFPWAMRRFMGRRKNSEGSRSIYQTSSDKSRLGSVRPIDRYTK